MLINTSAFHEPKLHMAVVPSVWLYYVEYINCPPMFLLQTARLRTQTWQRSRCSTEPQLNFGNSPQTLTDELCQVADVEALQRLRSSSSLSLIVSSTRLSTVGDRAFPVAAARVRNSLPDLVTSAPSVSVFWSRLKTHLFNIPYPSPLWLYSARAVTLSCFGHYNRSSLLTYLHLADRKYSVLSISILWQLYRVSIIDNTRQTSTAGKT